MLNSIQEVLITSAQASAKDGGIVGARNGMCGRLATADSLTPMASALGCVHRGAAKTSTRQAPSPNA
jgi:hypothetical protein